MTLVIAQLTDLHIGFDVEEGVERNVDRLGRVIDAMRAEQPDLVIVTGDLTQGGRAEDYRRLATALSALDCPVHLTVGNHDRRDGFAAVFADRIAPDGFVHFAVEHPELRCLVLDTLEEGRHGGAFCVERAAWLSARLVEDRRSTLIFLHHPPVAVGVAWMDPDPNAGWIERLHAAIAPHDHVIGLAAGHLHGASVTGWQGRSVAIAPSVAPALALSLAAIDPDTPDNRPMIVDSAPGFALHRWDGEQLTTQFGSVPEHVIARFNEDMQPMVRQMLTERDYD